VLPGPEEARLTFLAVRRWFGWSSGKVLMLDIGGGSLEIALGIDEVPDVTISLPLGAGRLTRDWLIGDPPSADETRQLRRHVRAAARRGRAGGRRGDGPVRPQRTRNLPVGAAGGRDPAPDRRARGLTGPGRPGQMRRRRGAPPAWRGAGLARQAGSGGLTPA